MLAQFFNLPIKALAPDICTIVQLGSEQPWTMVSSFPGNAAPTSSRDALARIRPSSRCLISRSQQAQKKRYSVTQQPAHSPVAMITDEITIYCVIFRQNPAGAQRLQGLAFDHVDLSKNIFLQRSGDFLITSTPKAGPILWFTAALTSANTGL